MRPLLTSHPIWNHFSQIQLEMKKLKFRIQSVSSFFKLSISFQCNDETVSWVFNPRVNPNSMFSTKSLIFPNRFGKSTVPNLSWSLHYFFYHIPTYVYLMAISGPSRDFTYCHPDIQLWLYQHAFVRARQWRELMTWPILKNIHT